MTELSNDQRMAQEQTDRLLKLFMESKASVEQTGMLYVPKFGDNWYGERVFSSSYLTPKPK